MIASTSTNQDQRCLQAGFVSTVLSRKECGPAHNHAGPLLEMASCPQELVAIALAPATYYYYYEDFHLVCMDTGLVSHAMRYWIKSAGIRHHRLHKDSPTAHSGAGGIFSAECRIFRD